jgi:hypothetical protein
MQDPNVSNASEDVIINDDSAYTVYVSNDGSMHRLGNGPWRPINVPLDSEINVVRTAPDDWWQYPTGN